MKVTELMIGDWVLINDTLHKIQTINSIDSEIQADNELYYINKIKSILLTPEILEKNGWCLSPILKCYSDVPSWIYEEDGTNLVLHFSVKQYGGLLNIFDERRIRSLSNFIWKNTLYVHELQHVLRLCGLNKLADNFKI